MAKKIYITSFKGGTGVTTCCVGLGRAFARTGERTLIVDGDKNCGCALIVGECKDMLVYSLSDYEKGACRAKQTLVAHPKISNLHFMPSTGLRDLKYAKSAVADVDGLFDYIILDSIAPEICDEAIIVTEPGPASVKSADVCRSSLFDGGIKNLSLIVNKLSACRILNGESMTAREISAILHLPLTAVIPEDLSLSGGRWKESTLNAFRLAVDVVTGKSEEVANVLQGYGGVLGYFKRKMREKV